MAAVLLSFRLVLGLWLLELNRSWWRGPLVWFWALCEVILHHEFLVLIEWRRLVGQFVEGRLAPVKVSVELVGPKFDATWDNIAWWVAGSGRHPSSLSLGSVIVAKYFSAVHALTLVSVLDCAYVSSTFYISSAWYFAAQVGAERPDSKMLLITNLDRHASFAVICEIVILNCHILVFERIFSLCSEVRVA